MCFMSTVTRKTDTFTATRGIATREAGAQAVTNEQRLNTVQRGDRGRLPQSRQGQFYERRCR